jgi:hypothetical protein
MSEEDDQVIVSTIAYWSEVATPNEAGKVLAAQFADTRKAFAALRGGLQFENEPSDFLAVLRDMKEKT